MLFYCVAGSVWCQLFIYLCGYWCIRKKQFLLNPYISKTMWKTRWMYHNPNLSPLLRQHATLTCIIVRDEAFGIMKNVMKPDSWKQLTYRKKIFNYRLSGPRRYIDCTFGIMAIKWCMFLRPLNIGFAQNIIKACCALHNYVRSRDGYRYENTLHHAPFVGLWEGNVCNLNKGQICRVLCKCKRQTWMAG